ncbi:MAG: sigma-70 family RNA polymerase sigma factor [Bacteroidaceae bacterium]|nr:sigma-70 family RNA polymerase sigma factor [Bacteroidaceae bacterium]
MKETTDIRWLAEAARRGDAQACKMIVEQCGRQVFSVVRRMVANVMDAEEVTQDALMRGLQQMEQYDPNRASLATWFCRIAYRVALNHLRKSEVETLSFDDEDSHVEQATNEQMMRLFQLQDDTRVEQLQDAIGQLSAEEQRLITWFYYDELPLCDIAYITQESTNALAVRLYRIRLKLYKLIKRLPI